MQINKKNMIESQLKPEGISCQKTLNCIEQVNREDFVPLEFQKLSYAEYDIPLKNNFHMLRPLIVAKILQSLELTSNDEILEIGTGSGYLTCCLSIMGKTVDTIDRGVFDVSESKVFIFTAFVVDPVASVLWSKVGAEFEDVCEICSSR